MVEIIKTDGTVKSGPKIIVNNDEILFCIFKKGILKKILFRLDKKSLNDLNEMVKNNLI